MYAIGMAAYCSYQILTRAFYSFKDTVTPLKISCWLVFVNLGMLVPMLWIPSLGAGAFGLSTAITFTINAVILMYLLRKRLGLLDSTPSTGSTLRQSSVQASSPQASSRQADSTGSPRASSLQVGGRKILKSVARTVVGCAVMAAVVYLLQYQLGDVRNWIVVTVCVPAGAITFLAVVWLLGAPELGELMGGIKATKESAFHPSP
jgi:peptidoglycan biosynthesis protein MviN/MurJ (putative lipid II flippase)